MPAHVYEILSLAMRYVFTLLGVVIVWRAFSWLRKDRRLTQKRLKELPDAGTIGELVVLEGSEELPPDSVIPVPSEGVLGYLRTCDVVVPVSGVARRHLEFSFVDGKGLYIYPHRGCPVTVDNMAIASRWDSRAYPMQHGSCLAIGDALLFLRVFAGLKVEDFSSLPIDEPLDDVDGMPQELPQGVPYIPDAGMPQAPVWQPLPYAPSQGIPTPPQPLQPPYNQQPGIPLPPQQPLQPPYTPPVVWPLNPDMGRRPDDAQN